MVPRIRVIQVQCVSLMTLLRHRRPIAWDERRGFVQFVSNYV
jgi:hypothetical protein